MINNDFFDTTSLEEFVIVDSSDDLEGDTKDHIDHLFGSLFDSGVDIVERNDRVFLFFKDHLLSKNFDTLKAFFAHPNLHELHRSLVTSSLVITNGVKELEEDRKTALRIVA